MKNDLLSEIPQNFSLDALLHLTAVAGATLDGMRGQMLEPHQRKQPPVFTGAQVAQLCGVEPRHFAYKARRGDVPAGKHSGNGARRIFTLAEARQCIAELANVPQRPADRGAATIAVCNFKGGSTKTTTAMNLAQGLTLLGRRVLVLDLDPQGSATTLTGLLPAAEVMIEQTAGLLFQIPLQDAPQDLRYAVQPTYWDGLDLIPAAPALFNAEVFLPLLSTDPDVAWWDILNRALEPLRRDYDYILIDTAPALSYLTVNAVIASDGLLMPLPSENIDFASSVAFWSLLSETLVGLANGRGYRKDFAFMRVLLSKVDSANKGSMMVRDWILHAYGSNMLPIEIPHSPVSSHSGRQFGTVYDMQRYDGAARTYAKIRDAYDAFVRLIDEEVMGKVWSHA